MQTFAHGHVKCAPSKQKIAASILEIIFRIIVYVTGAQFIGAIVNERNYIEIKHREYPCI